jgi:O-antigen/teichoic acid export membrane protein
MISTRLFSGKVNVASGLVSNIWVALVSIVAVPVYLRYLGIEAYGLIGILASLQAFMSLLDLGMSPAFNREVARLSCSVHH